MLKSVLKAIPKTIMTIVKFVINSIYRNVFRTGHVGEHHMRDGAVISRITRSDSFRRRYSGRHNYNIWKQCYGSGSSYTTATA